MDEKYIYGQDCCFQMTDGTNPVNQNEIIVGTTGSGKTRHILQPRFLETSSSSLVVKLNKRMVADVYKPLFLKRGYRVIEVDFSNPETSEWGYDPLSYVKSIDDISCLAKTILEAGYENTKSLNKDEYWDNSAQSLLEAEIALTLQKNPDATFTDVLRLNDRLEITGEDTETTLDDEFEELRDADPNSYAYCRWRTFSSVPIKTSSCIYGTLCSVLDRVFSQSSRKIMDNPKQLDVHCLGKEKTVLFLIISAVNPSQSRFVSMFYGQLFKELFEVAESLPDGALPVPVHVLCDDAGNSGKIANLAEYTSIFREKNISISLLFQSESQLSSLYGELESTTIMNNADTYVYLGGMDLKTVEAMSRRVNLPMDEILYMPLDQVIVIRRGQYPVLTKKYDLEHDERYQKLMADYRKKHEKQGRKEGGV